MISKWIRRLSMRHTRLSSKLILTYLLLTVIPMSLIGYISYSQYARSIEAQFGEYMPRSLHLANTHIEREVKELTNLPNLIYNSGDIVSILREDGEKTLSDRLQDEFVVNNYLTRTYLHGNNPNIVGVFMVTKDQMFYSAREAFTGEATLGQTFPYEHGLGLGGNAEIVLPNEIDLRFQSNTPYFMLRKQVTDFDNRKHLGTMFIAVKLSFIEDILQEFMDQDGVNIWIMNEEGQIIYHSDPSYIGQFDPELAHYPILNGSFKTRSQENPRIISIKEATQYNWVLVHSIPSRYLTERTDLLRQATILAFIAFAVITSVLSVIFALNVSRPIKKLSHLMKYVELGNLRVHLQINSRDEIGLLARSFNSMIARMRELIQRNVHIEIKQKEAEIYAMQAQINPHFMYNTLETIQMAVEEGEKSGVVEMVTLLGRMLRYSLSNDARLVPIDAEVRHVRDFLTIQKYRFEERVNFHIDVKVPMNRLLTPKFILQPIVENSLKYGLERRKGVRIHIAAALEFGAGSGKQDVVFRIRDDGPGIEAGKLEALSEALRAGEHVKGESGLGLRNVHARIFMMFGDEYGLQIDSIEGKGTEVIIRIPVMETHDNKEDRMLPQGTEEKEA